MVGLTLKSLLKRKSGAAATVEALLEALGGGVGIEADSGERLLGSSGNEVLRRAVIFEDATLGWVVGSASAGSAVAGLLAHLIAKESERRALGAEVLHLYREVHLIDQLSEQLAALLDLTAVAQSALDQARRLIAASQGCIVVPDAAQPVASFGTPALQLSPALVAVIMERGTAEIINERASEPRWRGDDQGTGSLICAPLRAKQRTVGLIALANDTGLPYSTADLKLLNTIALQTAAAIENSMLCAEMVGAVRDREQLSAIQKELDTARTIQHSLVPRTFPPFPERTDFDLHAQMTSAKAVGGDFFDFFLIDEDHLGVVIGDVSGKGTPSALYMAVTRTHVKTTALRGMRPEACLHEVNRHLVSEKASSMFATCFYGILNIQTGDFNYCNAGHNPPLLLRVDGTVEVVPAEGGLPLGMFGGMPYSGDSVRLGPGDALYLFTDGVSEANNAALDDYTEERLAATLSQTAVLGCREMIDYVMADVLEFAAGAPQSDDITMVALRRSSVSPA
ncbi:MAG: GAF domain-containing protein [Acidobacteriia bacterium]|jgi:sigma-B regulation protein RsbU (phosphoserine phosphatase)|nr:GAF domain-containing protein [Terriglobia bacterium]